MIKVFEAFSGIGSQHKALKNINVEHQIVGVSEIDADAIISYASIHTDFLKLRSNYNKNDVINNKECYINFLETKNIPLDYRTFINKARKLNTRKLYDVYLAAKLINNYGDINIIEPSELPDFDLFTYSFPCQDISVAGYQKGFNFESGTRSSLLWECIKIIKVKKPKYLLMENVKNLVGKRHKSNFLKFLELLESLGYRNLWKVVDAKKQGVPQSRERVFCVSILGEDEFEFPTQKPLVIKMNEYLETEVDNKYFLNSYQVLDTPITQDYSYCLDANYWKGVTLNSFLKKHRRQLVSKWDEKLGVYRVRRLTPKETWRLMGFSDEDFFKASTVVSNTSLYKQAGNTIVVDVLEQIFTKLFL